MHVCVYIFMYIHINIFISYFDNFSKQAFKPFYGNG